MNRRTVVPIGLMLLILGFGHAAAQDILLDKTVTAAGLKCYRDFKDSKKYYYEHNAVSLASHPNGKPVFSFIKYAKSEPTGSELSVAEAAGGGLVHFLVSYEVPDDVRREAEQELARKVPGAKLVGPVSYRSGMYRVEEILPQEGQLKMLNRVHAVGMAPLHEGAKCSAGLDLTKEGATLLWESFQKDTSQLSIGFEMELMGYRDPFEATITADWEKISKEHDLQVGLKARWVSAEIDLLWKRLTDNKAITIEQRGEDEAMEELLAEAQRMVMREIFERVDPIRILGGSGLGRGTRSTFGTSVALPGVFAMTRPVMAMILGALAVPSSEPSKSSAAWRKDLEEARREINELLEKTERTAQEERELTELILEEDWLRTKMELVSFEERLAAASRPPTPDEAKSLQLLIAEEKKTFKNWSSWDTLPSEDMTSGDAAPKAAPKARPAPAKEPLTPFGGGPLARSSDPDALMPLDENDQATRPKASTTRKVVPGKKTAASAGKGAAAGKQATAPGAGKSNSSGISLFASYKMRDIRRSGKTTISMKKHRLATHYVSFSSNIGNLGRYMRDKDVFFEVNLDDPVFKQREIRVRIDGQDSEDFAKFVNYVTVQLRKRHGNGQQTNQELRIDRTNFDSEGNYFGMVYGWKGDTNRDKWMEYDYRVFWSFFGGASYEEPWRTTSSSMIAVVPPTRYATIEVRVEEPDALRSKDVRHVETTIRNELYGVPYIEKVTLRTADELMERVVEYVREAGDLSYEYEMDWYLRGNRKISTGPHEVTTQILYCDDLPLQE